MLSLREYIDPSSAVYMYAALCCCQFPADATGDHTPACVAECCTASSCLNLTCNLLLAARAVEVAARRRASRAPIRSTSLADLHANTNGNAVVEWSEDSARFMYNSRGVPRHTASRSGPEAQAERLDREEEQARVSCVCTPATVIAHQLDHNLSSGHCNLALIQYR